MPIENVAALEALAAALRGETPPMALTDDLVDVAESNGVEALLAGLPAWPSASPAVASRLKATMAGYEMLSTVRDRELVRVLEALASGGVSPVLIKGAHLAHTIYASPALRPREDTDFVIAKDEQALTASLLAGAGYHRLVHVRGTVILGQCHFQRLDDMGIVHALDVHWRLAAPLVFRQTLPAPVLRGSRAPIPSLGPHAWGPSRPHALVIACVHLVAHHRARPILLWLHDIARIADTLDETNVTRFVETVDAARITAVCASALDTARRHFDGPALSSLAERVRARGAGRSEPSARLLTATRPMEEAWLDFRTADGWGERMTLVREHLWPDPEYIRATRGGGRWLPLAYMRRAVAGACKWLFPTLD